MIIKCNLKSQFKLLMNYMHSRFIIPTLAVLVVVTLCLAASSSSFTTASAISPPIADNFTGVINFDWPTKKNITKSYGFFDPRFKIPFPSSPLEIKQLEYPIASNTKLYIAVSLYQLHEKGVIKSMDDDIADYLTPEDFKKMGLGPSQTKYCPTVPGNSTCQKLSFRDLLGMTNGMPNLNIQFFPYSGSQAVTCGWVINAPLLFIPGSPSPLNPKFRQYFYSNAAYTCAGFLLETLSGQKMNEYMKKNIVSVVGLSNGTYFDPYDGKFQFNAKRSREYYHYIDKNDPSSVLGIGEVTSEFDLGTAGGAGGMISTLEDESKMFRYLFSNFSASAPVKKLLSHSSIMQLVTPWGYIEMNAFYTQGMLVYAYENPAQWPKNYGNGRIPRDVFPPPIQINYEGGLMGVRTANIFDLRYDPPAFAQAWTSTRTFFPSNEDYQSIQVERNEDFFSVTADWPVLDPMIVASQILYKYAGDPQ